ncbi:putative leucine-rich repeat receptor-like serine/threonine-protein kinase [Glycine soja]
MFLVIIKTARASMRSVSSPGFFFLLFLAAFSFANFASGATLLQDEVKALEDIAKTLGKKDWDFNVDPCSGQRNWTSAVQVKGSENNVTCDCTFANGTVCHVTNILLKSQNLPGTLPRDLFRLPFLQEIDLTRNYLNGTIPKEWGSTKLAIISLLGNRLTGSIPIEIANISTLQSLVLEGNQLSGNLPPELGNLTQIQRLLLSSNNFIGELPVTLVKLTTLQDIRIGDNQFSGKIPNFIQSLTSLQKLVIQGSGLSGPIPSGISFLENLTDLRISDLNGSEHSLFPQLNQMKNLKYLILRNCNINGTLPPYLGNMTTLKNLDLSFNKLTGPIPSTYDALRKVDYMNLFASSMTHNDSGTVACLGSSVCQETLYSLHINCGGKIVTDNGSTYDDDSDTGGPARFHRSGTKNWAYINTGNFMDNDAGAYYIVQNKTLLSMDNVDLYMDARVSPISLTYYGFCLGNGNYTVNLHFAEIMFIDDQTFNSLGRRVFDIYIQGALVKKDFDIVEEAGGIGKAVITSFTAVVTSNTLEIRLYWAGKGTTSLPFRSVYGPLISAISVEPDFTPPSKNKSSISVGVVVGVVAAGAVVIILVLGILWWKGCFGKKSSLERELQGLDLRTGLFTLRQIKAATNNFDVANKIGEGGFGPVYKGCFSDGTLIAVKQLSSKSRQGNREFLNEIGMISALQHPHLVKLYGCCVEGDQLLLVYEYMENNSLARALFGAEEHQIKLDWTTRYKICVGIARGLAYLHEESRLKIVHRDIKATNVLLDQDLNPKISDFGLAKLDEEDNTHISTRIAGTFGYMAPEYAMHGYLTDKADVYSFGIVALEIINGRSNTIHRQKEESFSVLEWAHLLREKGDIMDLVDRRLGLEFNKEEALVMIKVALLCTNVTAALRPTMSSVVSMLEGKIVVDEEFSGETTEVLDEKKMEKMRLYYQELSNSKEEPWTASSTSVADLYPEIAKTLGKENWDFSVNPCYSWNLSKDNMVSCNCDISNDSFCHVMKIALKSQNLRGNLPPQLIELPYLQEIELSRNYLSGTIPRQWGSSNLQKISLLGNRITGPIPKELGKLTNLTRLILEFNQLSGKLPSELGNLVLIKQLHLSSNNFTGPLPATLARLTTMDEFRINDNQFSGNIPDFIGSWKSLDQLHMQGSGLSGPIPSGISLLNLTDLRISDLNGPDSTFPRLENMTYLKYLILRSCNINDTFPQYLVRLSRLQILDLSYNKLNGPVPKNLQEVALASYIYLTGNFLTGLVPEWTSANNKNLDLSYNNFSVEDRESKICYQKTAGPVSCENSTRTCTKNVQSLYINCGGKQVVVGGITYDEDMDSAGPAVYKQSRNNWAFSNTGQFMDNNTLAIQGKLPAYTTENETRLYMTDAELYKNARISPMSLTYYGFCLENGDYTVKLHFAEIMFTADSTYSCLGRRLFDVYIQGRRVLKDFNIANEAQGVGKELIKEFPAHVSTNDLEIRFYWAGKGTTNIPYKSVYGPLISAISVKYAQYDSTGDMSAGVIVAIVAALVIVVILIVLGILWWMGFIGDCCWNASVEGLLSTSNFLPHFGRKKHLLMKELRDLDLQTGVFTLHQIKVATNNFDISNKIGEGGFGPVYKGILSNSKPIAVKQLSPKSEQGTREFINEIGMISALQHPNLVKLYGCCVEGDQLLLVYEYMENNSLAHAHLKLSWPTRKKICVGIARGLAFMHEESRLKVVHRDLKTSNVLLDEDLNPKISDFGLARLREGDNTHISTRIAGTWGYMAPEYAMHGYLTEKADVYSFGVITIEIVSGKRNTIHQSKEEAFYLLDWARLLKDRGSIMELVDPRLGIDFNEEEVMLMVKVALLCTNVTSTLRPSMSTVLNMLEGRTVVPEFVALSSEVLDEMKLGIMREFYSQMEENNTSEARSLSLTMDVPWTCSSSSAVDLNPAHLDASCWEKKKLRDLLSSLSTSIFYEIDLNFFSILNLSSISMKKITSSQFLLFLSLLALWFTSIAFGADTTHPEEVQALKDMGKTLGKKEWDTDIDPCSGQPPWFTSKENNNVTCNCTIPGENFCHVVIILLKSQNLRGMLPRELIRLPYLEEIDLTKNYLNGTIPTQWGSSNLRSISLYGNRLTGPIPKEIANITNLQNLVLEFNQFSGNLPPELGNLPSIQKLHLTSNNFTGELPETLAKLTTLTELTIQGSGLSGPIPSEISFLQNLYDLRISDLNGSDSAFPPINNMTKMKILILRSCHINDTLPQYLGNKTNFNDMQVLDLSYNKLSGNITEAFQDLLGLTYLYFTGNSFTGPIPNWVGNAKRPIIVIFRITTLAMNPRNNSHANRSKTQQCKNLTAFNSFHINCGGERELSSEGIVYDPDLDPSGAATSKIMGSNWAFSNTGHFLDAQKPVSETYIQQQNKTGLSKLYQTARVSPISLTYYGFCLENGDYTVLLHFAEIMFTDDNTYSSLGRRIFDVYIQGVQVMKDFNIANEAGGVGKNITRSFPAHVRNNSLIIRFYWAGKGTTAIPYGPLISAISVTHVSTTTSGSMSTGVIVGIVVAAIVLVILIVLGWRIYIGKRNSFGKELKDLNLQTNLFTMRQIKVATNNFDISNKIGEGGFGPVYKGILSNGMIIAVKMLSSKSKQGNREFINEIGLISALQHPCLVKLYGCCVEGDQLLLVYEYMENNSLAQALFGNGASQLKLNWPTRHKICIGIARGLAFLHEESTLKIVHRDIKATNVLLDKDLNPKISDFEYAMHGYLTDKADVYSFGVVALEIVSGKSNTIHRSKQEALHLLDWAHLLKEKGNLMELVDRRLGSDFNENEVMMMIKVALLCTNTTSNLRPTMSSVLSMLEGKTMIPEFVSDPSEIMDEMKLEAMRQHYFQKENERSETQEQNHSLSIEGPWTASSSSAADLYPVHVDSSYWEKRN